MPRMAITTALPGHEKPLPKTPPGGLPSPTLTNPDYILPANALSAVQSPPRLTRRPPSPSYLRDESPSPQAMAFKKERHHLGLMSRKMLLLRSRTASGGPVSSRSAHGSSQSQDFIPSSPILQDVGNLAPEQPDYLQLPEPDRRSGSARSSSSDMSSMPGFLAKYGKPDGTSDDEAMYDGGDVPEPVDTGNNTDEDSEASAARRKQEQEEYQSAILSKRAEQILANAKKRLNVMEGNLRGARDLVTPLTAANLKRATSVGSARYQPAYGRRHVSNGNDYEEQRQQSQRRLQMQFSSPTIGRDYQGHTRGFSETDMPERTFMAVESPRYQTSHNRRAPAQSAESSPVNGLRGSKSYDSLGAAGYGIGRERSFHTRESSESSLLETLQEADERRMLRHSRFGEQDLGNNSRGAYQPSSRTTDLREQMSSLKGKISSLRERAREESLRRQSQSNLRNASLFNNALTPSPELYHASSASPGSSAVDRETGLGLTPDSGSPALPPKQWDSALLMTGSRNAFAEQAALQDRQDVQQTRVNGFVANKSLDSTYQARTEEQTHLEFSAPHRRTTSEAALGGSANSRYSHRQQQNSREVSGQYLREDFLANGQHDSSPTSSEVTQSVDDDGYAPSEAESSVYEDARDGEGSEVAGDDDEQEPNAVVAHEDREDAFDYKRFFLHSAMSSYKDGRRGSQSSEGSVSSVETAKGPAPTGDEEDFDDFSQSSLLYPLPTPETPEKLREIERNIHKRSFSEESTATMDTFATAEEDAISPVDEPIPVLGHAGRYSISPMPGIDPPDPQDHSRTPKKTSKRPSSRPGTAVRRPARRDSSSERADSGVGLPRRPIGSSDGPRPAPGSTTPKAPNARSNGLGATPPSSPGALLPRLDPAAMIAQALLDPHGKPLGLRNKAVLFGVIESLRTVVHQLQEEDEAHYESRVLRRKLDEAKLALDGRVAR